MVGEKEVREGGMTDNPHITGWSDCHACDLKGTVHVDIEIRRGGEFLEMYVLKPCPCGAKFPKHVTYSEAGYNSAHDDKHGEIWEGCVPMEVGKCDNF